MTNDSPTIPIKRTFPGVLRGQLTGGVVGYTALAVALASIFGPRTGTEWTMPTFLIGWLVGGAVGGTWQLRREGRTEEVGKFVGQQFFGLLLVIPIIVAALVGQRLYGNAGWWIGLLASVMFVIGGVILYARWKSGSA